MCNISTDNKQESPELIRERREARRELVTARNALLAIDQETNEQIAALNARVEAATERCKLAGVHF